MQFELKEEIIGILRELLYALLAFLQVKVLLVLLQEVAEVLGAKLAIDSGQLHHPIRRDGLILDKLVERAHALECLDHDGVVSKAYHR